MKAELLKDLFEKFVTKYDAVAKDEIWAKQSKTFKEFWKLKLSSISSEELLDSEIDEIVKILDQNGKGNRKGCEAVAKVMVAQGTWRKLFREFVSNKHLYEIITNILEETDSTKRIDYINQLYVINEGKRNFLTGQSGNVINTMLAAYNPIQNTSMISVSDRLKLLESFEVEFTFDYHKASHGERFVNTNQMILDMFHSVGLQGSARTLASFCYHEDNIAYWKSKLTVKREDIEVEVSIPDNNEGEEEVEFDAVEEKESIQIQALLAEIGAKMGFSIWLPRSDRARVLKLWQPTKPETLMQNLPLNYDSAVMKTIENIDVLWLKKRMIVRAFEVEHTTAIYSGILRMADLLALVPNIDIRLHIVAPPFRGEKVLSEIRRPVFSLLDGKPMSQVCTFLSYDYIRELFEDKNLEFLSDSVLDKHSERAFD